MTLLTFPYGKTTLAVTLPEAWVGELVLPSPVPPAQDALTLIASALEHPIGTPPLSQLAKPGQKLAILIDDFTRRTPVQLMLPLVLAHLASAHVSSQDIRIVIAAGTHRPMTEEEIEQKVGPAFAREYEIIQANGADDNTLTYVGTSSRGIPTHVNRAVAEADIRIGLGMITPHLDAGFSGGMKIVLPGVCSSRTVDAFHRQSAFLPENQLGRVDAPLRLELEQFVRERVPLHFIVNAITTLDEQVYQCVAGHPLDAHRAGVKHAQVAFGARVRRRYPIVVANCYPYDLDLWQSVKGIWAGDLVTADGGTLIAVTAATEGNSTYPLVPHYIGRDLDEVKREIEIGRAADDKQAATGVMVRNLMRRIRLALVSDGLTQNDAATMGIPYYATIEEAVRAAINRLPAEQRDAAVAVLPQAGIVLPILIEL